MARNSRRVTNLAQDSGRTITRGAKANAAGLLLRLAARIIFLFIAARLYGAHLFGTFVFAAALIELAVSIGSLATKKTLFPLLDRATDSCERLAVHIVIDAALLVAIASLLLALIIAGGALLFAPPAIAAALFLLAPMIAGQALLDLFLAASRWRAKVRYEVVSRSLIEPWFLAGGAIIAFQFGLGAYGLAAGYWCGTLAALVYAVSGVVRHYPSLDLRHYRPDRVSLQAILRAARANSINDFLNAFYMRIDLYLVGLLLGPGPTGIYGMARQVATPIRQVRQSFDGLLIPAIAKIIGMKGAEGTTQALASAARLILVIQLPLFIAMLAVGQPLMAWLGTGFEEGYWALIILALAEVLQSALGLGDLVFVYLKPRIGLALTLISIVAGIITALLLIPPFGITGAAFALLAAYALRSVLRFGVLYRQFGIPVPYAHLAGPLLAAGVAAAIALAIPSPALAISASLGCYAALLVLWLKATGQGLALTGFAEQPEVLRPRDLS